MTVITKQLGIEKSGDLLVRCVHSKIKEFHTKPAVLKRLPRLIFLAAFALHPALCGAQAYPNKPIRFIVPYPPGGGADIVARMVGQKLGAALGQQVIVDNRPGGGAVIGADLAAKSTPDGYTLLLGNATSHAINASLHKKLPYDPVKDFAPISMTAHHPLVLVAHPSLPANSVIELIKLAKAKPGELFFASTGNGSSIHLAGELINMKANVKTIHVPYKGAAPALSALMGGQVQFMFTTIPPALPLLETKRLKVLAIATPERSSLMPGVSTLRESGISGLEVYSWTGVLAPATTPQEIIARLHAEIVKILSLPDVVERFTRLGAQPFSTTPAEFAEFIRSETAKYAIVVRESGAKID